MNALAMRAIVVTEDFLHMTFEQFKTALLMSLATALVGIAGFMATSLWSLNEKMAVIVEKVSRHDEQIRELTNFRDAYLVPVIPPPRSPRR